MYYGFNELGLCIFSASGEPAPIGGVTILQDDRDLDITKIRLSEGMAIVERLPTPAEQLADLEARRQQLLRDAASQISLLSDVAELDNDAEAKALADKWRLYRVELYKLDLSDPAALWPPLPGAAS